MASGMDCEGGVIAAIRIEKSRLMPRAVIHLADGTAVHALRRDAAGLKVGDPLTENVLIALQQRYQQRGAYLQAVRFLGPRDRSVKEIADHLRQKAWDAEACAAALARLQDEGYVDDPRFARTWVAYRCRTAPRSRLALSQELKRKGIARAIIQAAVADMDEEALALACARRKIRQWQRFEGDERRRRIIVFLQRKGFPYDACRSAADSIGGAG